MSVAGGLQIIQDLPLASEPEVTSLTILKNDTYKNNLVTNPWILLLYIVSKSNRDQSMVCGMVFLLRVFSICDFFLLPSRFCIWAQTQFFCNKYFPCIGSAFESYIVCIRAKWWGQQSILGHSWEYSPIRKLLNFRTYLKSLALKLYYTRRVK